MYNSLVYGIVYLTLFAYPYSFGNVRHWRSTHATLPFLALLVGFLAGTIINSLIFNPWWKRRFVRNGNKACPEDRLLPMFVGALLLPSGLFWFAWTSSPTLNYWPQVISGAAIGIAIVFIFVSSISYLVDVYLLNANSALAANAFVRALFGAAFPLFAQYMYGKLGVAWATSVLGFLAAAMIPFPFLFWFMGKRIRSWSKFSFVL